MSLDKAEGELFQGQFFGYYDYDDNELRVGDIVEYVVGTGTNDEGLKGARAEIIYAECEFQFAELDEDNWCCDWNIWEDGWRFKKVDM